MNWILNYHPDLGKYQLTDRICLVGFYTDEELQELYVALIDAGIVTKTQQAMDRREATKQSNREREEEIIVWTI